MFSYQPKSLVANPFSYFVVEVLFLKLAFTKSYKFDNIRFQISKGTAHMYVITVFRIVCY